MVAGRKFSKMLSEALTVTRTAPSTPPGHRRDRIERAGIREQAQAREETGLTDNGVAVYDAFAAKQVRRLAIPDETLRASGHELQCDLPQRAKNDWQTPTPAWWSRRTADVDPCPETFCEHGSRAGRSSVHRPDQRSMTNMTHVIRFGPTVRVDTTSLHPYGKTVMPSWSCRAPLPGFRRRSPLADRRQHAGADDE